MSGADIEQLEWCCMRRVRNSTARSKSCLRLHTLWSPEFWHPRSDFLCGTCFHRQHAFRNCLEDLLPHIISRLAMIHL